MRKAAVLAVIFGLFATSGVVALNLQAFPKDISFTKDIPSYKSSEIIGQKLWNETPLQLL
ncbi:hypothetical protein [Candidatus Aquiluna sp. UB-MaderosW2red]|uniref:hypothetical protein n=1 Tax=Candidatus Aquiluna sp. UB-MaderosW2red TaxID=1855377 RepID=UPI0012FB4355|nr:hypothetical protein [Candidatus Aquiluna sp. UB-MaderosW2red]